MRGEYKTPGGKLVGVDVTIDGDRAPSLGSYHIRDCRIDGDFFIDGGDEEDADCLLTQTQQALIHGEDLETVVARFPHTHFIGVNAAAIQTAFDRAVFATAAARGPVTVRDHDSSTASAEHTAADQTAADHAANRAAVTSAPAAVPVTSPSEGGNTAHNSAWIAELWQPRWEALHLHVVHDEPRMPEDQMRVDEQWAREVAVGRLEPTLRVWEWSAPTVVIGHFQSIADEVNLDEAEREGVSVVRRCTGGGAMFIEPGNTITYSLYAPLSFVAGMTVVQSYQLCDQWLVRALRTLGLDVRFSGLNDIASQHGKIGGAAQRRFPPVEGGPGSVLHHVTLAYDIDAEKMGRILNTSQEKLSDKAVRSAVKRVDPMRSQTGRSRDDIVRQLLIMAGE